MHYEVKEDRLQGHLRVSSGFSKPTGSIEIQCYTFIWNRGIAKEWLIDLEPQVIPPDAIFSLSPGQTLSIPCPTTDFIVLQFNREFYCVQDHDNEVSCNGILFNGALTSPILKLDNDEQKSFETLLDIIMEEFGNRDDVQFEMMRTVMKRFIIKCTRLARDQFSNKFVSSRELDLIRYFSALVERHFRSLHRVSDYADLMHKSPKTLSNVFKALNQKTPLQIIHERLTLEAKKLLLYTDKSVKEIAYELNFSDPVQFSRLFKAMTGVAPAEFKKDGLMQDSGKIVRP